MKCPTTAHRNSKSSSTETRVHYTRERANKPSLIIPRPSGPCPFRRPAIAPGTIRTPGISGRAVANWRVGQQRFEGHNSRRLARTHLLGSSLSVSTARRRRTTNEEEREMVEECDREERKRGKEKKGIGP